MNIALFNVLYIYIYNRTNDVCSFSRPIRTWIMPLDSVLNCELFKMCIGRRVIFDHQIVQYQHKTVKPIYPMKTKCMFNQVVHIFSVTGCQYVKLKLI
jgi:hypothetical protein